MASEEGKTVPIIDYPNDNKRMNELKKFFHDNFAKFPDFFVKVPGRVNLIGEHIDYCGYGVCPMALQQDFLLAVSSEDSEKIELVNTDSKYEKKTLVNHFDGCSIPKWYHYFLCGVKGVQEALSGDVPLRGMNVAVDGIILPSAGLSSSSALVSAAALATFFVNNYVPTKGEIADLCAKAERYIGTQGGGMDQAIAFLANEGCAKFIEFDPLQATDVKLPEDAVFVIAHSLVEKNKAASNDFNCRVVECKLAAQVIAKKKGLDWRKVRKLADVQNMLSVDLKDMITLTQDLLHDEFYNKIEIAAILEVSEAEIVENFLTKNTKDLESFNLKQRALHVFKEAERVKKFKNICEKEQNKEALTALGRLMYESHESLKDLYEASHPQLDRIVEISKKFCYGCRLTGAGWGGCTVALTSPDQVENYITSLKNEYYSELGVDNEKLKSLIFSTSPQSGACIYKYLEIIQNYE